MAANPRTSQRVNPAVVRPACAGADGAAELVGAGDRRNAINERERAFAMQEGSTAAGRREPGRVLRRQGLRCGMICREDGTVSSTDSPAVIAAPWTIASNLWRHRELAWQFARREIEVRHRGSRLGPLWALVNPLSMLALYWFIFGKIFHSRFNVLPGETEADFVVAMFFGLAMFHVFSETLGWAPVLITSNPNFVK